MPDSRLTSPTRAPRRAVAAPAARMPGWAKTMSPEAQEMARQFVAAAKADNTKKAYVSAIRSFLGWGGMLPADAASVKRYLVERAVTHKPSSLALHLSALSYWHKWQGFPDPAAMHEVRELMTGIRRIKGRPPRKAPALLQADMGRIARHLAAVGTLKARRDSALLQLGFYGGFRRSELAGLQVSEIAWTREGIVITLPRSKTDQEGAGISRAIPYGAWPDCACAALRAWLDAAGIARGPVFRAINKGDRLGQHVSGEEASLGAAQVNIILVEAAAAAGVDGAGKLSGHSLRRGMATSARLAGAQTEEIQRHGGWRDARTVQGYIDDADLFTSNIAGKMMQKGATATPIRQGDRHKPAQAAEEVPADLAVK